MTKEPINSSTEKNHSDNDLPAGAVTDQASSETPAFSGSEPVPAETRPDQTKGKTWLQKGLGWVAVVLVSLVAGAALVIFLLYLPADRTLRQAQSDLTGARSQLEVAQAKADGLQSSLTGTSNELDSAKGSLESANLNLAVARLQANIAYARLALLSKDTLTARQELSDAEANLAELTLLLDDSETASALADRLKTIRANLTSDSSKALNEMRTLGENLSRLENR